MPKYTLGGDPPQSRSEQILMGQDTGPSQSRLEELLKNGAGGGVTPEQLAAAIAAYFEQHPIEETDPTVPSWAKHPNKPRYTMDEVGTARVTMTASDTTPTLDPNTFYVFPEMASLTPTLNTPSDATIVNEYHFIFTSGAAATTLTLPASVLQPDGFTVEANHVYEVSILENCMTAQGWAVAE